MVSPALDNDSSVSTQLARRNAMLDSILQSMPSAVMVVDLTGQLLVLNQAAQDLTGFATSELPEGQQARAAAMGLRTLDGHPLPLDKLPLRRAMLGETIRGEELLIRNPRRPLDVVVEANARPLHDIDGKQFAAIVVFTDISDRKQSAQVLAQSEERYRTLVANSPGMVFRSDPRDLWGMVYVSEAVERLSGYPVSHFIEDGALWSSIVLQEDLEPFRLAVRQQVAAGSDIRVEYRIRHRSGRLVWCEARGDLRQTSDGQRYFEGVVLDITDRKITDEALAESERRYRHISDGVSTLVFSTTPDGQIDFVNSATERLLGASNAEIASRGWTAFFHADDMAQAWRRIGHAMQAGLPFENEARYMRADGEARRLLVFMRPSHDQAGRIVKWFGSAFDVEDLRRAQASAERANQALADSERRFRDMAESLPIGMIIASASAHVEYVNPWLSHALGYGPDELGADRWPDFVHPDDLIKVTEAWARVNAGFSFDLNIRQRPRGGEYRWFQMRAVQTQSAGNGQRKVFISEMDIEDLVQARQAAEDATRMKSAFLSSMSHEIRTPMNAVIGMTSILLDSDLNAEQRDSAEVIRSSGEHLLTVINDILDYSKIEAGSMQLERAPFSLRDCIESALDLVAGMAQEKNVELGYLTDAGLVETLQGDIGRLRQILVNLISNAIKFSHSRGQVSLEVRSRLIHGGEHEITFDIRDTGIGIAADVVPRLFQSFTQADASTTRQYGGTGLGLSISKKLVELMGGSIDVISQVGIGSTFTFTICMPALHLPHRVVGETQPELRGKNVLIVDDVEINRRILKHYGALWGMVIYATEFPQEALEWVRRGDAFDLALLDFHMPDMDGLQLARELRVLRSEEQLPILILSSVADHALAPGVVSGAVVKPIKPARLLDEAQKILSRARHSTAGLAAVFRRQMGIEHPLRILVAEDNAVNQKVAKLLLARMGYTADFAGDGEEALEAISRQTYDVVFMDVQMPRMDGLDASREICRRWTAGRRPRIVSMTANASTDDRRACELAGMDDYLPKPVVPERVVEALLKCVRRD